MIEMKTRLKIGENGKKQGATTPIRNMGFLLNSEFRALIKDCQIFLFGFKNENINKIK